MDLPDNYPSFVTNMENIKLLDDITNLINKSKQIHTELIDILQYNEMNNEAIISAFDRIYRTYLTSYGTRVNVINRKGTTIYKAYYKIYEKYNSILITEIDSIDIIDDNVYFGNEVVHISNKNGLITKLKNNLILLTNGLTMLNYIY